MAPPVKLFNDNVMVTGVSDKLTDLELYKGHRQINFCEHSRTEQ